MIILFENIDDIKSDGVIVIPSDFSFNGSNKIVLNSILKDILNKFRIIEENIMFGSDIYIYKHNYKCDDQEILDNEFKVRFNYDNINKEIIYNIPESIEEIPSNYEHGKYGFNQDCIGYFREELIDNGIFDTFIAIEKGFRCGTSRVKRYKKGDFVLFTNSKYDYKLLCLITKSSYKVTSIDKKEWSKLEGWDEKYLDNSENALGKYQFQFKFIKKIQ